MRQTKLLKYLWENRVKVATIGTLISLFLMLVDYLIECKYPTRFQWLVAMVAWLFDLFLFWVIEPKPVYENENRNESI